MQDVRQGLTARLQVLAAAVVFSTGGAAVKATGLSGWQVASFRSGIAALTVFLLLPAARRRLTPGIAGVAVAYAGTLTLFVTANKLTTAAATIFLQSTAPLYLLLLAPWLLEEPVRRRDLLYMLALGLGLSFFFVDLDPASATAPDPWTGNLLALGSGVTWAFTVLGLRWLGRGADPDTGAAAVLWGNVFALVAGLPWALPVAGSTPADWAVVSYLGVVQIGLAYILLTRALRSVPAFEASLLLLVEPVLNPVWAWWLHGETPGTGTVAGGALILAATGLKTVVDARQARRLRRSRAGPRDPPAAAPSAPSGDG